MFASDAAFPDVGASANTSSNWPSSIHDRGQSMDYRPNMTTSRPKSSHQRSLTEDNRRRPLIQMRSRSNTSTSSSDLPFSRKALSPEYSVESSPRGSIDQPRTRHAKTDIPESFRKTLVLKSSRLFKSRPSSRDDLTSLHPLDWSEEFENDICPAVEPVIMSRPVSRHFRKAPKNEDVAPRYNISEPFNFQHLTHTEPVQFKKMEEASQNDFVSEFSAMRASQAPQRELQGIKADIIIPRDEFYHSDSASDVSSPHSSIGGSPRLRYGSSDESQHGRATPPSPLHDLHHATSIDSFSQISPLLPRDPTSSSARVTSRHFAPDFFADHQASPSAIENFPSIIQDTFDNDRSALDYPIAIWDGGVYDLTTPHAMTSPDDKAHTLRPPPFQMVRTELSRVLEEDELSEGRRSIATVSTLRPASSCGLRSSKSFPNLGQSTQKLNPIQPQHAPTGSRTSTIRPSSIVEQSTNDIPDRPKSCEPRTPGDPEQTWEDAIDWCYDNEAEANCNFDWSREVQADEEDLVAEDIIRVIAEPPMENLKTTLLPCPVRVPCRSSSIYSMLYSPARLPQRASSVYSAMPPTPANFPRRASSICSAAPTLVVPSQSSVPDLDPPSAVSGHSSLDSICEAVTPKEEFPTDLRQQVLTATCKPTCRDWTEQTPAPPVNEPECFMVYEDLYHVIHARKSLPEPSFDFGHVDGSTVSSISPRSSCSAITKKSSQESVWSRHNRHSSSSASVPDFAQSKAADIPFDHLTDHHPAPEEASGAYADASLAAAQRRHSPSLAREFARNSVRSKVLSQESIAGDVDESLSWQTHSRQRSDSDASLRTYDMKSQARTPSMRTRSESSAVSIRSSSTTTSPHRQSVFPNSPIVR